MLMGLFVKNHNVKGKLWYCLFDMSTMSVWVWDMKSITVIFLFIRFVMSEKWIPPTVFLSGVCCDAQQHRNGSRNGSWRTGSCRFLGFTNSYRHFIGNFCSSSSDPHILRNLGHVECSFQSLKVVVILCSHSHPTCPEPPVCRQGRHVWFGSGCSCLLVVWFQHTTTSGLGVPLSPHLEKSASISPSPLHTGGWSAAFSISPLQGGPEVLAFHPGSSSLCGLT